MKYLILCLLASSCSAINYVKRNGDDSWATGYYDKKIAKNKYIVGFQGNGHNSPEQTQIFFLKRSSQIAKLNGFKGFCILSESHANTGYGAAPWYGYKGTIELSNNDKCHKINM